MSTPVRWRDDPNAPDGVRELLAVAEPTPWPEAEALPGPPPPPTGGPSPLLFLGGGLVGMLALGAWLVLELLPVPEPTRAPLPQKAAGPDGRPSRASGEVEVPPVSSVEVDSIPEPPGESEVARVGASRPKRRVGAAPRTQLRPTPKPRPARHEPESSRPTRAPPPATPDGSASALPSELELLVQARLAVAEAPQRAIDLVEQLRARFPVSSMAQERDAIEIEAQLARGARDDVEPLIRRFRAQYPESPYPRRWASPGD